MWQAARSGELEAPVKHCFAVAKDGVLLFDSNPDGQRLEMDSAGKTVRTQRPRPRFPLLGPARPLP